MQKIWTVIEGGCIAVGAAIGWFLGEFNGFLIALIVFMGVDIVTGIIKAAIKHEVSSKISFQGLAKKVFIILVVGLANVIDTMIFKEAAVLRTSVIFFYIANEGISIIENMSGIGLPIPKKLINALAEIKKEGGEEDEAG